MTPDQSSLPTSEAETPESGDRLAGDSPDACETPASRPPEALGRRFFQTRTLISFGIGILVVWLMFRGLGINVGEVWSQITGANPALYVAAFFTFYSAIVLRSIRWRWMLRQAGINASKGHPLPSVPGTSVILTLSLFVNCIVPARLGDVYRSYLLREKNGASFGVSFGTILAERLIDVVVMVGVVLAAGAVVFGTNVPGRAEQAFLLGLGVVVIGVISVTALYRFRERLETWIPDRFTTHFQKLNEGIFTILSRPFPYIGVGILIWLLDGLRVYFIAHALGANLSIQQSVVVALLSALVTIIPFTPAGVGFVEGFMIWILPQMGVAQDTAAAIALLDRSVTFLSLIAVGMLLYLINIRRRASSPGRDGLTGDGTLAIQSGQSSK